jgi:hypothetical protein
MHDFFFGKTETPMAGSEFSATFSAKIQLFFPGKVVTKSTLHNANAFAVDTFLFFHVSNYRDI